MNSVITIIGGLVGLAVVAVIVSKNAQTPAVLTGAGQALSSVIAAAVSPVSSSSGTSFGAASSTLGALV